jgi:purine-binding chemotaxis protein CheW
MEYVLFKMAGRRFGVPIIQVREVVKVSDVGALPQAPDFISGVMTVRRHSVAVFDLPKRLGIPSGTGQPPSYVLVARVSGLILAVLVDEVADIRVISDSDVDVAGKVMDSRYYADAAVTAIAQQDDGAVVLLDFDHLLDLKSRGDISGMREGQRG